MAELSEFLWRRAAEPNAPGCPQALANGTCFARSASSSTAVVQRHGLQQLHPAVHHDGAYWRQDMTALPLSRLNHVGMALAPVPTGRLPTVGSGSNLPIFPATAGAAGSAGPWLLTGNAGFPNVCNAHVGQLFAHGSACFQQLARQACAPEPRNRFGHGVLGTQTSPSVSSSPQIPARALVPRELSSTACSCPKRSADTEGQNSFSSLDLVAGDRGEFADLFQQEERDVKNTCWMKCGHSVSSVSTDPNTECGHSVSAFQQTRHSVSSVSTDPNLQAPSASHRLKREWEWDSGTPEDSECSHRKKGCYPKLQTSACAGAAGGTAGKGLLRDAAKAMGIDERHRRLVRSGSGRLLLTGDWTGMLEGYLKDTTRPVDDSEWSVGPGLP
jgi:hypothetical protein